MWAGTDKFRVRGILRIVLYRKTTRYHITCDVRITLQKSMECPLLRHSKRTFENSGYSDQMGGPGDQHKYVFIYSKFLYMHYLDKFQ